MIKYLHIGGPLDDQWIGRGDDVLQVMHQKMRQDLLGNTVEAAAADAMDNDMMYENWLYERISLGMHGPKGKTTITVFSFAGMSREDVSTTVWVKMLRAVQQRAS